MRIWWFATLVPLALVGCAGVAPSGDTVAQMPVSQQTAVGDARRSAKAHTELGMAYLHEDRLNVAMDEARAAIDADPSYPLGYNLLGVVQMYLKENRAAEENLGRALRLAPADPEINNNYGWFLCQSGRERQSIEYFVTAGKSTLYGTPTKPLTNAGICSIGMGDDKAAEDFLLRALRADSMNGDAQYLLADIYYRTGRLMEARQRLAEIHKTIEPTVATAWLGLRVERKFGDAAGENHYGSLIRRKFQGTREYDLLMQGRFE